MYLKRVISLIRERTEPQEIGWFAMPFGIDAVIEHTVMCKAMMRVFKFFNS